MSIGGTPVSGGENKTPEQTTGAAPVTPTTTSSENSGTNGTILYTLLAQFSEGTETDSSLGSDEEEGTAEDPSPSGTGLSSSQTVTKKSGDDEGGGGGDESGEQIEKKTETPSDPITGGSRFLSSDNVKDTTGSSNQAGNIDDREMKQIGENATSNAKGFIAGLPSSFNSTKFASTVASMAPDFSQYAPSIGLSSSTVAAASAHFRNAADFAQRLDNVASSGGSPVAAGKLLAAVQAEITKGFQAVMPEIIANPSIMEQALLADPAIPAGPAAILADATSQLATSSVFLSQNDSTSGSSSVSYSAPSIYTLSQAIGAFAGNAAMGTVLQNEFMTLESNYNAQISTDTDQQANASMQNVLKQVKQQEQEEQQAQKKRGILGWFTQALSVVGGASIVAMGVFIACVTAETGVGVAGGAMIAAIGVGMTAQAIDTMAGGNSTALQALAGAMAKATGTNAQDWTIALETTAVVVATMAGAATLDPMMALMMFSTVAGTSGAVTTDTEAMGASSQTAMWINLTVSLLPIACGAFSMMSSLSSAEESSTETVEAATETADSSSEETEDASEMEETDETTPDTATVLNEQMIQTVSRNETDQTGTGETTGEQPTTETDSTALTPEEISEENQVEANLNQINSGVSIAEDALAGIKINPKTPTVNNTNTSTVNNTNTSSVNNTNTETAAAKTEAVDNTNIKTAAAKTEESGRPQPALVKQGYLSETTSAKIGKIANTFEVTASVVTAMGSVVQGFMQIALAKTMQEIAVITANVEVDKAELDALYAIMQSLEQFNSNQIQVNNTITGGLNEANASMSQDAAGDYSNIWTPV